MALLLGSGFIKVNTFDFMLLMMEGHHQQFSQEASFLAVPEDVFLEKENQDDACIVSICQALPKSLTNPVLQGEENNR